LYGPVIGIVKEIITPRTEIAYAIVDLPEEAITDIVETSEPKSLEDFNRVCTFSLKTPNWVEDFWPGESEYNEKNSHVQLYGIYNNKGNGLKASFAKKQEKAIN